MESVAADSEGARRLREDLVPELPRRWPPPQWARLGNGSQGRLPCHGGPDCQMDSPGWASHRLAHHWDAITLDGGGTFRFGEEMDKLPRRNQASEPMYFVENDFHTA